MERIKLVLICSFSNSKVRKHLPLDSRKLYGFVRKILHLPAKTNSYGDVAGWDTYMIELLRKRNDVDLYVISAHSGLKSTKVAFELEGVHYYFIKSDFATFLKHVIPSPKLWHSLNPMRPVVAKILKGINPNIIALIGAENSHISGTIVGIKNVPIIVKCQTIYNNPNRKANGFFDEKNAYVERLIFKEAKYVSTDFGIYEQLFRVYNKTAYNFIWSFGNILPEVNIVKKEYDFVNYAMGMSPKKGFPDAIEAIAIVKKKHPEVTLNLVGGGSAEQKAELKKMADDLGVGDNVFFTPFFEKQEDLFQHIQKSKFAILPCKMDSIASTIRQAMHYGLPVICYRTDGTPSLNSEKQCVLIAENGDVQMLAEKMLLLLEDHELVETLKVNAKNYASRWSDDERISNQMMTNFMAVMDNYNKGVPVPKELLYIP